MIKLTKTTCTQGPATGTPEAVIALAQNGMSIARLNFSHGNLEEHRGRIHMLQQINKEHGFNFGIMLDTKGPEIRTGDVETPIQVTAGQEVVFAYDQVETNGAPFIKVNYPEFLKDVKQAKQIIVDNGEMIFDPKEITDTYVRAVSHGNGSIGNRRHVNLPGCEISLPAVSDKDRTDIAMGCEEGVDFIALSFVSHGKDVEEVRAFCAEHGAKPFLISKIENELAVRNIDEIIEASDGIMVARGDLGAEIPPEQVPAVQDEIVEKCWLHGKPVIVATQMLESMIKNPLPTRAECMDVAYAAKSGADSTMLSGETAAGKYPLQSLQMMSKILVETEKHLKPAAALPSLEVLEQSEAHARACAAYARAHSLKEPIVLVLTRTGETARALSQLRPSFPIVAALADDKAVRQMQILYGVVPLHVEDGDSEAMLRQSCKMLIERGIRKSGDQIVVVSSIPMGDAVVDTIQLRQIA